MAVAIVLAAPTAAEAQTTSITATEVIVPLTPSVVQPNYVYMREAISRLRPHVNSIRRSKCYSMFQYDRRVMRLSRGELQGNLEMMRGRHQTSHTLERRPCTAVEIIRAVFPSPTEDSAISVARCESNLYTYARNPSGASGLFQLMPGWWAGKFNPFNPWANTRFARVLSRDGYDWSHWVCKPY